MSEKQEPYGETPADSTPIAASPVNHTVQIIINLGDSGRPFAEPQDVQIARLIKAITDPDATLRNHLEEVEAKEKQGAGAERIARAFEVAAKELAPNIP